MANETPTNDGMLNDFRRQVPGAVWTILLAGAISFATSWWKTQDTQNTLQLRVAQMEERQKDTAAALAASAQTAQANAVRLAELSVQLQLSVEEMRRVREEHERDRRK